MEQLDYNCCFAGSWGWDGPRGVVAVDVLEESRPLAQRRYRPAFFDAMLIHADSARLFSDEHFTVDGTFFESWASHKSFHPRDEDPPASAVAIHREFPRAATPNATHQSTTDPDARLYQIRAGEKLGSSTWAMSFMEHRSGLIVDPLGHTCLRNRRAAHR